MDLGIIVEAACFIVALICLPRDRNLVWRIFIVFMLLTCLTEVAGLLIKKSHHHNDWLYNIFLVFEASFTSLMFNNLLSKYTNSKPIVLSGLAIVALLYVYEMFDHGFFVFNLLTETIMSVIFVIYSFYFYYLLIKEEQYVDLKRSAPFWWVTGTLFFYFGSTACNLFYKFLSEIKFAHHSITYIIFVGLSIILYGCWSYSFICRRWSTTTSNS